MSDSIELSGYASFIKELKSRVQNSHIKAVRAANRELILLHWDIGAAIVQKQESSKWGDSVINRIAADLSAEFPDMSGFSGRNLRDMKRMWMTYSAPEFWQYLVSAIPGLQAGSAIWPQAVAKLHSGEPATPFWPQLVAKTERTVGDQGKTDASPTTNSQAILKQLVAEVPWGHHRLLLSKFKEPAPLLYYLQATAQLGWSRQILLNQIKAEAYERSQTEDKSNNFDLALPSHFAEQAREMMKSRYNLEFLDIAQAVKERDLEKRLTEHLQRFILELGYGFCFIGRQHRMVLGEKDYYVDLLFYHRFLKSLVAFDLKIGEFEPEHAGKMDFYLNLLNDHERAADDQPSIGIILCAEKSDIEVEYALKDQSQSHRRCRIPIAASASN